MSVPKAATIARHPHRTRREGAGRPAAGARPGARADVDRGGRRHGRGVRPDAPDGEPALRRLSHRPADVRGGLSTSNASGPLRLPGAGVAGDEGGPDGRAPLRVMTTRTMIFRARVRLLPLWKVEILPLRREGDYKGLRIEALTPQSAFSFRVHNRRMDGY